MRTRLDKIRRWVTRCGYLSLVVACGPDHFVSMGSDGDDRKDNDSSNAGGSSNTVVTSGGAESNGCGGTLSGSSVSLTGGTPGSGGSSTSLRTLTSSHSTGGTGYHLPMKL
jgi:hypothetical protein